jgi:tetratricopeptide (TPR) repeat protein
MLPLIVCVALAAQDAGPVPTPESTYAEAADLVEVKANTRANLLKAIELYEKALPALDQKKQVEGWIDVSRAYLRLGDLEKKTDAKVAWYEKGRAAAQKAMALDPKSGKALAWDAFNLASVGNARGVLNSLFMVPDLKKMLGRALELDPNEHYSRNTLARIYHLVPGIAGGSDKKSEEMFLDLLKRDPDFTPAMFELGRFYADNGDKEKAKEVLRRCVEAKRSSVPNDWRKFDKPQAQKLLESLDG